MSETPQVTVSEDINVLMIKTLSEILTKEGYIPADVTGMFEPIFGYDGAMGMLDQQEKRTQTFFFGLSKTVRRMLPAAIFWGYRPGTPERLFMEVYGRENLEKMRKFAEKLASETNRPVHVHLSREYARWEHFLSDNDMP